MERSGWNASWSTRATSLTGCTLKWSHSMALEMEPKPWASESSTSPWRTTRDSMFLERSHRQRSRDHQRFSFWACQVKSDLDWWWILAPPRSTAGFCTWRGRRNRPLGLKMHPWDQVHPGFKIPQEPVALMAGNEDDEGAHGGMGAQTAPWKRQCGEQGPSGASFSTRPSSSGDVVWPGNAMWRQHGDGSTEEIKPFPARREDQFPQDPQEHGDGHNGRWRRRSDTTSCRSTGHYMDWGRRGRDWRDWWAIRVLRRSQRNHHHGKESRTEGRIPTAWKTSGRRPATSWCDHVQLRRKFLYPTMSRMELPVDLSRLELSRTMKVYEGGEMHEDRTIRPRMCSARPSTGVSKYQRGPVGAHLVKRMTYDAETDELLASDDIKDLMGPLAVERELPEGVHNIRTDFHMEDVYIEGKIWTGSTIFKLKTMDPWGGEALRPYEIDPQKDRRRYLTKGQKKNLEQDIEDVEEKDMVSPDPEFGVVATPMEVRLRDLLWMCTPDSDVASSWLSHLRATGFEWWMECLRFQTWTEGARDPGQGEPLSTRETRHAIIFRVGDGRIWPRIRKTMAPSSWLDQRSGAQ